MTHPPSTPPEPTPATEHSVDRSVDQRARAVRAVRALARVSRVLDRASDELNLAHYRVLAAIASGDERASRIAARLALGKPTVSAAVSSLTQRGLLTRVDDTDDRRATALSLTPQGRALLDRVEAQMVARIEGLAARTPDPDHLLDSLGLLDAAIDEMLAERAATQPGSGR